MSFSPVRCDGGGLLQVMEVATSANPGATAGVIAAGSDTQGYYRTTDGGNHWTVQNYGIGVQPFWRQCASIAWSTTENNTVYACTGEHGNANSGGLLVSNDGMATWQMRATAPQFSGNSAAAPVPTTNWLRSTGRLLTQHGSGVMLVGTFKDGVMASTNNGNDNFPTTCKMNGLAKASWPGSYYCRGMFADPNNAAVAYAGFYDYDGSGRFGGIWKSTNATAATPNFTQLTSPCPSPEEILVLSSGNIYAVGATTGLVRSTNGGTSWTSLNNPNNGPSVDTTSSYWTTLDGYVDSGSGSDVVIIVCSKGIKPAGDTALAHVMKFVITTGGVSTSSILTRQLANVNSQTIPPTNYLWWNAGTGISLGKSGFVNPCARFDPTDSTHQTIYIAASMGLWRSTDGGANWTVANSGCPQFLAHPVVCDPNNASHIIWGDSDWGCFDDTAPGSEDGTTLINTAPVNSAACWSMAIDPNDSTVWASVTASGQKYTDLGGDIWARPGNQPNNWSAMNFVNATDPTTGTKVNGHLGTGLFALRDGGGIKTLLAGATGSGLWRWQASGANAGWNLVDSGIASQGGGNSKYLSYGYLVNGTGIIYVFDRLQGVYRSKDYGLTWTQIWAITATQSTTGHIALNPLASPASSELWVADNVGLYKLTNAQNGTITGGQIVKTQLTAAPLPGPIGFGSDGTLYVASNPDNNTPQTRLVYSTAAQAGTVWRDAVGDNSLARCNALPEQMAIASDGQIFLSGSNIVAHGYPVTTSTVAITTTSLPAAVVSQAASGMSIAASGGTGVFTFSATGLPAGLHINASTGAITGTPTTVGTVTPTFTATDSANNSAQKAISITVYSPAALVTVFDGAQSALTINLPVQHAVLLDDAIIFAVGNSLTNITAVGDTQGNQYQKVSEASLGAGSQDNTLWVAEGVTPLTAGVDTFSVTAASATGSTCAVVGRAPGILPTSAAVDRSPPGTTGSGTAEQIATARLSIAPEMAFVAFQNNNAGGVPALPSNWNVIATHQVGTTGIYMTLAFQEVTTTAAVTATATLPTTGAWLATLVTLVELAATGVAFTESGTGHEAFIASSAITLADSGASTSSFTHTSNLTPQLAESGTGSEALVVATSLADVRAAASFTTGAGVTAFNVSAQQCQIGDQILIECSTLRNSNMTWSCPGFTYVAGSTTPGTMGLLYKTASATDVALFNSSGNYVVTANINTAFDVSIVVVLGANAVTPYDPSTPTSGGTIGTSSTAVSAPGLTLGVAGDLAIWFGVTKTTGTPHVGTVLVPQTITPPAGYTIQGSQVNTNGANVHNTGAVVASGRIGSAGATGAVNGSVPAAAVNGGLLVTFQGAPAQQTVGMSDSGVGDDSNIVVQQFASVSFTESGHANDTLAPTVQITAGAPTQNGFTVVAKVVGLSSVQIAFAINPNAGIGLPPGGPGGSQVPDSLGYVRFVLTGLQPGTQYFYQLIDAATQQRTGPIGQCKTLPPAGPSQVASFRVAFGSCIAQSTMDGPAQRDWTDWDPDVAVFLGDFDYSGTTSTSLATQVGIYEQQIASAAGLSRMVSNGWGYYCRSEHEAGPNSGDSNNAYTATNIAAAQEVFPFGQLGDTRSPPHGLYQSWTVGRVRFIMLDVRNIDRSPGAMADGVGKTMLGATQLAWFLNQLVQPEPLKVIICDVPWLMDPTPFLLASKPDAWWSYNTERQSIANFIQSNLGQVKNVLLLHANTHVLASATAALNNYGGFPVYCAAPLVGIAGGVGTGAFSQVYNPVGQTVHSYGRVTFTDNGSTIQTYFSGWDAGNAVEQLNQTDTFYAPLLLESGTGTEAFSAVKNVLLNDSGTGATVINSVVATRETLAVAVALTDAEGGTATESLKLSKAGIPLNDSGTGTDRLQQGRGLAESGSATTTILVGITKHLTDTGTG